MGGQAHLTIRNHAALLVLLGCAAVAWYFAVLGFREMAPGPGTMGFGLAGFLAAWSLMMAAMMLPALSPLTTAYLRSIRSTRNTAVRVARTAGLVAGYLVAWAVFGAIAFAAALLAAQLATEAQDVAPWVGAGVVASAGIYQLTPLKDFCLRHCRSPVAFLLHVAGYKGRLRDLRVGLHHGLYCIGCCWGLMVVLIAVGVMNLAWMAAIAVVVFLEKAWSRGRTLSKALGVGLIMFALFVPGSPSLLPGLYAISAM